MEFIIRQETSADFDSVYEVVKAAFLNAEHTDNDEQNLVIRLRNSEAFVPALSLVATINDAIVGYIMFTKIKIKGDKEDYISLALAPLCVSPWMQCRDIGSKLILEGHKIAKELGFKSVVLLGHPTYYPRFSYVPASQFSITAPFDVPDEAFMACELINNGLSKVTGVVEYPKEFLLV